MVVESSATFISITDERVHDVNVLDEILQEAGAVRCWMTTRRLSALSRILS
jgi:hypothetical protein